MSWRSVAVYYAVAAILGGYLWFAHQAHLAVDIDADGGRAASPIVETLASRIDGLVITAAGVRVVMARGGDRRWRITKPAGLTITSDLIAALLDTVTTIPPIEVLHGRSEDLGGFGLVPAEISLQLSRAGQVVAELDVGKRNPTRTAVYVLKRGSPEVYLLGLNVRYYLELVLDELARQRAGGVG